MSRMQADITQLHRTFGHPVGGYPRISRRNLRADLIAEEATEACEALLVGNIIPVIKELCDVLVVTFGTAVECGVDLDPFWREVHRSNMAKEGGPVREDGKVLKPEGWLPPDLHSVFERKYGYRPA